MRLCAEHSGKNLNNMSTSLWLATATSSLGKPGGGHSIATILRAAAKNGIRGIEICYEALLKDATDRTWGTSSKIISEEDILESARIFKNLCNEFKLVVIVLQPFASYEGNLDLDKHRQAFQKWQHWLDIAYVLDCDLIQMPSNFDLSGTTGDIDRIVTDLREIADLALALASPVRIAYEAVAWGTHFDLWDQSWAIVKAVDRSNFGLCLDTFHIAGRVWGDPTTLNGKTPNADADLEASLVKLVKDVDVQKVFYVQLSDAEKMESPLLRGHPLFVENQRVRCTWSRAARLFPCEEHLGGYLPVLKVAEAIVNHLGYRGWVSMELFSRRLLKSDAEIPSQYACRAMQSYQNVYNKLGWGKLMSA